MKLNKRKRVMGIKKIIIGIILILIFPRIIFALGGSIEIQTNNHYIDLSSLNRYIVNRGYPSFGFESGQNRSGGIVLSLWINDKSALGFFAYGLADVVHKNSEPYMNRFGDLVEGGVDSAKVMTTWLGLFLERRLKRIKSWEITANAGIGYSYGLLDIVEHELYADILKFAEREIYAEFDTDSFSLHAGLNFKYKFFRWGKIGIGLKYDYVPNNNWEKDFGYYQIRDITKPEKINLSKFSIHAGIEFGGGPSF